MTDSFAPLGLLLRQPGLCDLLLNGCDEAFADFGTGLIRVANPFQSEAEVEAIAREALALAGRHIDFATPAGDATIGAASLGLAASEIANDDKFRVHAVLASALTPRTLISIRRHAATSVALNSFTGANLELETWLRAMLERRENFLVSGAAAAGKTTFLRALMSHVGNERVIAIDDTGELEGISSHTVALQTRQANTEGRGEITLDWLLRQALRMRPDRIVLGEVRGPELLTLLSALNTGHSGAAGSIHANSAEAVATRINTIALAAGWGRKAVASAAAEALSWVIHLDRQQGVRRVAQISRVVLGRRGELKVASLDSREALF